MNNVLLALLLMLACSVFAPSAKDDSVREAKISNVINVSNNVSVIRNKATLQLCLVALLVIVENLLIIR